MLRAVVLGSGLVTMMPSVNAATPVKNEPNEPTRPAPMRPSELPIYEAPHAEYAEFEEAKRHSKKSGYIRTALQGPVRVVREHIQTVWAHTDSINNAVHDNFNEFQDRTQWIVRYLREEENKQVRSGAVIIGGLTGFIFGLRGGIIRKVLYAGLGTTAMGMICFPEETKEFTKNNGVLAKQYINIAYNFLYGVKPGDPQLEVHFPELSFPKNFSEFVDLSASVASSVKQAVMPPPTKEAADPKATEKNN
ncbi:MICOS complex subunit MIC27 [Cydia amplana]|uniref:MICOS complex subunit MIC27 n=1 Tax=Cydia amplana TaxID=1869771 RepID=UPI002FE5E543